MGPLPPYQLPPLAFHSIFDCDDDEPTHEIVAITDEEIEVVFDGDATQPLMVYWSADMFHPGHFGNGVGV